jgi:hypothetical protein
MKMTRQRIRIHDAREPTTNIPAVCPNMSKLCSVFKDAVSTAFPRIYGKLKFVAAFTPKATNPIAILGDSGLQKETSLLNIALRDVLLFVSSGRSAPDVDSLETSVGTSFGTTEYFAIVVASRDCDIDVEYQQTTCK